MAARAPRPEAGEGRDCVRKRGRPTVLTEAVRRTRLVEAGEAIFLERGYAAATMEDVAQKAGMSKKTLYQLFDGKPDLFRAVLRAQIGSMFEAPPEAHDRAEIAEILCTRLTAFTDLLLTPRQIATTRLIVGEAHREPELAEAFRTEALESCPTELVAWLDRMSEKGLISVERTDEAVEILLGAAIGASTTRMLTSPDPGSCLEAERKAAARRVRRAVGVFMVMLDRRL